MLNHTAVQLCEAAANRLEPVTTPSSWPRYDLRADSELSAAELHDRELGKLQDEVAHLFAEVHALTYRALVKLALFDSREYWAGYQSCVHWMNFRLGISFTTAREHLRVARALSSLPAISAAFAKGTLSYSKVRAVTRIANEKNDDELARLASAGTATQVDKVVRACRKLSITDAQQQVSERSVQMGVDDDGMFFMRVRVMADEGVRLAALVDRYMSRDRERDVDSRRADALSTIVALAEAASEQDSNVVKSTISGGATELVVHVDAEVLSDPTAQGRAQIEGSRGELYAVAAETVRRLCCDAAVVEMKHEEEKEEGHVLDVGRRSRKLNAPLRRAILERDRGCRFPGCPNTWVDAHHVKHWADGGETSQCNIISMCKFHHMRLHEGGFTVMFDSSEARSSRSARFFDAVGEEVVNPAPIEVLARQPSTAVKPFDGARWDWAMYDYRRSVDSLAVTLRVD